MAAFGRPGVYVQETAVPQNIAIQDRSDAIAGFIGALPKGPTVPTFVNSWSNFVKLYGNLDYSFPTSVAVYQFFTNGGRDAYIDRAVNSTSAAASIPLTSSDAATALTVTAKSVGSWGNQISVEAIAYGNPVNNRFSIVVYGQPYTTGAGLRSNVLEQFNDLSATSTDSRYAVTLINNTSAYITVAASGTGLPAPDAIVHSLAGGTDVAIATTDIVSALTGFDNINTPLLLNAPDLAYVGSTSVQGNFTRSNVISAVGSILKYAEYRGDAFAIVDTPNLASAFDAINFATDASYSAATAGASTISSNISSVTPGTQGSTTAAGYVTYTTTSAHSFVPTQPVTITNVTREPALNASATLAVLPSTPSTGQVKYVTAASHGFKTGDLVTISGITGTVGTTYNFSTAKAVTVIDSTSFYVTSAVTGSLASNADTSAAKAVSTGYSGTYTIYSTPTNSQFVIANAETGTATLTGASASVPTSTGSTPWTGVSATGANAAMYYPWLVVPDTRGTPGNTITIPTGGAIIGKFQATDASRGVFKTPAGYQTSIAGAVSLGASLSNSDLDALNSSTVPVNALRTYPGAGIVVMGGRTMSTLAANRYINTRRSLIYLKKELRLRTSYAIFENNDAYLWNSITNALNSFLGNYWAQGGLRGNSPFKAFYVKCDSTTTTDTDVVNGRVNVQVGVALEYPAEFIVINIGQFTGGTSVTQG
jgi:hypothetical protein